jgi:hypothetical protein
MPKDGKKTLTHGKSKKKLPELLGGKESRESKQAHKSEPLTPTTVSSLSTSTPTSNLSATLSKSITSNGKFCSTIRTLQLDDLSTAPMFEVKMSTKTKKPAYSVKLCNSAETLAECVKYVTNPKSVPKDQELQLTFLLDQYKPNDLCIAFCQLISKVGGSATTAFQPLSNRKNQLIKSFLALIYITKSMLVDTSKNAFK